MEKFINFGNCISMSRNSVTINGETIKVPNGANVSVINGELFINGKKHKDEKLKDKQIVNIIIEGNVKNIDCQGSVTVNGNVDGNIDCGGSVSVTGMMEGDIDCGGSCNIKGGHKGSIDAGGSVSIR